MKQKWKNRIGALQTAVRRHPAEMFLSVVYALAGCWYYESKDETICSLLWYAPVTFLLTYTLNRMTAGRGKVRVVYFLFAGLALYFSTGGVIKWSSTYIVSLAVVQLIFLISRWERDDRLFVETGLRYVMSWMAAGALALIAWLLAISIYFSVWYIFEIRQQEEKRFFSYAASFIFGMVAPLLFLVFNKEERTARLQGDKVFDMLLNFVLTPILLIYAAILYVYFLKIVFVWSLPRGAVAYIVVSFVSAAFLLKGCQDFVSRRMYDWFYDRVSWAVLPALVMYAVGCGYRIREYGFTEARVYLVVVGIILAGTAFLFFSRKRGRYLYAGCLAAVLLSVVTYIPGLKASDIERYSQAGRPFQETEGGDVVRTEPVHMNWEGSIDIRSYSRLEPIDRYSDKGRLVVFVDKDSLFVACRGGDIWLACPVDSFWNGQLRKAGLSKGDEIPPEAYRKLLEVELDSGLLVLNQLDLDRTISGKDTVEHIFFVEGACLLIP